MNYFNLPKVRECHVGYYDDPVNPGAPLSTDILGVHPIIDQKALVLDNGAVANTPTSGYKTIQHEEFFLRFKEYLLDSMGNYSDGYSERVSQSHNGARAKVLWEFPRMSFDIEHKDGTRHPNKFFVHARHSHDGKWGPMCVSGLMNFFCENLDMSGEWKLFRGKHTSGFSLDDFLAPNVNWVDDFVEQRERQRMLQRKPCSDSLVINSLENAPKFSRQTKDDDGNPIPSVGYRHIGEPEEERYQRELSPNGEKLYDRWKIETQNYGDTLFAFSSAIAYWASHDSEMFPCGEAKRGASKGNKNVMSTLQARQEDARAMFKAEPFLLAA